MPFGYVIYSDFKLLSHAEMCRLPEKSESKLSWPCEEVCSAETLEPGAGTDGVPLDPPRGEEYWIPTDPRFSHALDLVSYIRSSPEFSDAFSLGVAGHFDSHAHVSAPNSHHL